MAPTAPPIVPGDFYMVDLDFARHNYETDTPEYIATTAYSPEQFDTEYADLTAAGWTHYMTRVV